jgi:hypothetical protein
LLEALETDLTRGGIGIGERLQPVRGNDHARDGEPGLIACGEDLGLIHAAADFDAVKTCGAEELEFFQQRQFLCGRTAECSEHKPLFHAAFFKRDGGFGGGGGAG